MTDKTQVGFIGIGNMGGGMAANLVKAGYAVTVYDADKDKAAAYAKEHHCEAAADLKGLARSAKIFVTMLPTGPVVRQVVLEAEGGAFFDNLQPGSVIVDMTSSEPVGTVDLGARLKEKDVTLIDAPVSGGSHGAADGTLAIMIGTDSEEAYKTAEPVLLAMGEKLFRTGGLGSGDAMKSLNNLLAATSFAVASEALLIGKKFGLDPTTMVDIINASTGMSFTTQRAIPMHVVAEKFGSGFQLGLMTKDVKIAADLAEDIDVNTPLTALMASMWIEARDSEGPTEDFTTAYKHWEKTSKNQK